MLPRALRHKALAALAFCSLLAAPFAFAAPRPWLELHSPHFVLVTNAGEHDAREAAEEFETIRSILLRYFQTKPLNEQPLVIVAVSDEASFKPLLPEAWTQKGQAQRAGVFLSGLDKSYIFLRLDVPRQTIYHEYVHYLLRRLNPSIPTWLVEGLAEFYSNFRPEGKSVAIGAPAQGSLDLLKRQPLLPLTTLFEVDHSSPYYNEQNKVSIFYAESWALTHYLIARDWQEKTDRLNDFINLLGPTTSQVDAAKRTIGDPAALQSALDNYVYKFAFTAARIPKPEIPQAGNQLRELSEAESLAVRADLVAHQAQYAKAEDLLQQSRKLDPNLALAFQVLAFVSFEQNRIADTEQFSSHALLLDPTNVLANYFHGASLLSGGFVDQRVVENAMANLRSVVEAAPNFAPAYDALANALSRPGPLQNLDDAHLKVVKAVELDPTNVNYRVHDVQILEMLNRPDDAVRVATVASSIAKTPAEIGAASYAMDSAKKFKETKSSQQAANAWFRPPSAAPVPQPDAPHPLSPLQNQVEVLSNPTGADLAPYLRAFVEAIQKIWPNLVPNSARPPISKKGKAVIDFAILPDGSVSNMKLVNSSTDPALDRAAWGSIVGSTPFKPLPTEFKGPHLALRLSFVYNPGPADPELGLAVWRLNTRYRESAYNKENATADFGQETATLTSILDSGRLSENDELLARYYRAFGVETLNGIRLHKGGSVDLAASQQALDDFDQVIAQPGLIASPGITTSGVEFYAGRLAFQMKDKIKALAYWHKCADLNNASCLYQLAEAHIAGDDGESVDFQQALDLYHQIYDFGALAQCTGSNAALRIAKLAYFLNLRRSPQDDALTWVQNSYDRSGQIATQLKKKTACDVEEARLEEFLYRLGNGERKNDLLDGALKATDNDPASRVAAQYFSGAIDQKAFDAAVAAEPSRDTRCYRYFSAFWFSEANHDTAAARKYFDLMLDNHNLSCRPEIVFAEKKFGFEPHAPAAPSAPTK